ncbi:MAG: TlyA family RNA methyltransferase [Nitrospirae bacterium]|nr:MAG: TlyA family RNA methyltransferase [Nitrospirota bacterium]
MKERIDKLLVKRGLCRSRERASALIMEGKVLVDGIPVKKSGMQVDVSAEIRLRGEDIPYVSRGGLKIDAALKHFRIDLEGKVALDVGASTGGFTDCMLQRGASKVYALDVGYGQIAWKLRNDPRVVVIERTNIRHMPEGTIPEKVDFVTIDVSFISILKVIPHLEGLVKPGGMILSLIKPQFEAGKGEVDKGGVIRDAEKRKRIVSTVLEKLKESGYIVSEPFESPVAGQKGNVEYFVLINV